jgi:membrane protein
MWALVKETVAAWIEDYAPSMGAALAYYTLFSVAPVLIIVIAVAGFFFGEEAARGELFGQVRGLIGDDGAAALQGLVQSADKPAQGAIATAISLVTMLLGATAVFGELQSALDRIWQVPKSEESSGVWNFIRTRMLSFAMVLGLAFLLLVSLVVSAALSALGNWWGAFLGEWEIVLQLLNFAASFAVFTGMFALIYKYVPRIEIAWRDVWVGAAVTALLFSIGKSLIGLYIGKSGVTSGFGAAGSLVALMVWVYYSAQIFLLGAEFTWVYSYRRGSRRGTEMTAPAVIPSRSGAKAAATRAIGDASIPIASANPAGPRPGMARTLGAGAVLAFVLGMFARR